MKTEKQFGSPDTTLVADRSLSGLSGDGSVAERKTGGQAMRALGLGRLSTRILRDKIVATGVETFALVNVGGTPESARNAQGAYTARKAAPDCPACGHDSTHFQCAHCGETWPVPDGGDQCYRPEPQRVCAHCQTQIIPSGLTECPKCDRPVMP